PRASEESLARTADAGAESGSFLEENCFLEAQQRWLRCQNAALEPVEYALAPSLDNGAVDADGPLFAPDPAQILKTGAYPALEVQGALQNFERDEALSGFFYQPLSFFWATKELTQYSDLDISSPSCSSRWDPVKAATKAVASSPK
ncbi:unnamed protein product, partial [Polarella glacialis]